MVEYPRGEGGAPRMWIWEKRVQGNYLTIEVGQKNNFEHLESQVSGSKIGVEMCDRCIIQNSHEWSRGVKGMEKEHQNAPAAP